MEENVENVIYLHGALKMFLCQEPENKCDHDGWLCLIVEGMKPMSRLNSLTW